MLELRGCAAGYGDSTVFDGVSFRLGKGSTAAVVGPSGCGKSTLLALLAGIKRPRGGELALDGTPVERGDRRVGLILQSYGLLPWMTSFQNVALGLKVRGVPREEREAIARRELERLDIEDLARRYPAELSGGQQQRVAIARTFAVGPSLLLMDEPFSALDTLTRERLQDTLARRLREARIGRHLGDVRAPVWGVSPMGEPDGGVTTVLVTHSIEEAVYLGTTLLVFLPGGKTGLRSLPNAHEVVPGFRMSLEFAERCREVRSLLEEHNGS